MCFNVTLCFNAMSSNKKLHMKGWIAQRTLSQKPKVGSRQALSWHSVVLENFLKIGPGWSMPYFFIEQNKSGTEQQLSFQELLNYGTHCLPLLSPKPTTCHPSNLTSTYLISSLYTHNLSPFSKFFLCRGIVIGPKAFPCHYTLKKKS